MQDSTSQKGESMMRSWMIIYGICIALMMSALVAAPTSVWAKDPINKNWRGLAVKGYDPVAYFTLGKPVKGKSEFEYEWEGARWRFSNSEHLNLFAANPEKYAPQYGGY
jgi:YHS domain-containing protein